MLTAQELSEAIIRFGEDSALFNEAVQGNESTFVTINGQQLRTVPWLLDNLEKSNSIAAALVGPIYGSIAAGLAGTADQDEFAVDNGNGTASIYLDNDGAEVFRRTIIIDPAHPGTAALLGYTQGGSGAVTRTVAARLQDYGPTAQDHGAVPTGSVTSAAWFSVSSATVGADARDELQALIDRSETERLPIVELASGTGNYSLTSGPLELQGGGTTIRGQRGMTYSRGLGKNGAVILGPNVKHGIRVGDGTSPASPGDSGADCFTFQDIGFLRDSTAPLKSQSGIYFNLQSNGPPRGVNLFGVSATGLLAGFEVAPPIAGCSTMIANLTIDGVCLSNNRYGLFASGPLYGLRVVASQIEQNNAFGAPATGLKTVAIGSGGTGYTAGRRVWLTATDGTGRGASGIIAVTGGAITGVTIDVEGFDYTVGEALTIVSGTGSGATATVGTVGAPSQWEGGAIHGNIQGPITIVDNQIEGQPNPIDLQPIGGPVGVGGSANIAARISQNYIETVNVNSSEFVARLGTTERFHVNSLDFGPNFYAGTSLPPDFLVINKRGNWLLSMKDRNAITFNQWNGSILRGSNIFGPGIDHFYVKGFSSDPNSAPEIFLGDGFSRYDDGAGDWTHSAAFTGGEDVYTPRGLLNTKDATLPTPLGFGVTAGDLIVVTAYVSVQDRDATIFRGQVTRNNGSFLASINDSYADVISKGDWVHICYVFLAPSSAPDIAFKYGTSGGGNTVKARIAGLCARNYGAYTNDGVAREKIVPVAPRLV